VSSRGHSANVLRAVISVDAVRRRRLLDVLSYVEHRHSKFDPDIYDIDLAQVGALKNQFTTEDEEAEISFSFTHEDLFALSIIIDAADTYSTRSGGQGIDSVSKPQLEDLRRWVAASERWFITPLKWEMLHFDPETHQRITEVLWYVENRAWVIDPDMFRIDVEKVHALQKLFRAELEVQAEEPPVAVAVNFQDVNTLAYYTIAAQAYSTRRTEKGLLSVSKEQLDEMISWLSQAADRLISRPN
jgi:hypothetical protein